MVDVNNSTILTDEEKATVKWLKKGYRYWRMPVAYFIAWVFGGALFGTEINTSVDRLKDTAFIVSSIWTVAIGFVINKNGRQIINNAEDASDSFLTINRLVDKRRNLFLLMMAVPLVMLIVSTAMPVSFAQKLMFKKRNSLVLLWFLWTARTGFRQCDSIFSLAEKLNKS